MWAHSEKEIPNVAVTIDRFGKVIARMKDEG
jgi:hypothetical protein